MSTHLFSLMAFNLLSHPTEQTLESLLAKHWFTLDRVLSYSPFSKLMTSIKAKEDFMKGFEKRSELLEMFFGTDSDSFDIASLHKSYRQLLLSVKMLPRAEGGPIRFKVLSRDGQDEFLKSCEVLVPDHHLHRIPKPGPTKFVWCFQPNGEMYPFRRHQLDPDTVVPKRKSK